MLYFVPEARRAGIIIEIDWPVRIKNPERVK
jgi:hypothetical protein